MADSEEKKKLEKSETSGVISGIFDGITATSLIVDSFNQLYGDSWYYLYMSPLDNNITLKNLLIQNKDLYGILEELQNKYNIYKNGYNIFVDGNIFFIVNRFDKEITEPTEENKIWKLQIYHYVEDKLSMNGRIPCSINKNERTTTLMLPSKHISFRSNVLDFINSPSVIMSDGTVVETKSSSPRKEYIEDYTPSMVIEELDEENNEESEEKDSLEMAFIEIPSSFNYFKPNDIVEIQSLLEQDRVWRGTVKRWVSEMRQGDRLLFLVATGKMETKDTLLGNEEIKLGEMEQFVNEVVEAQEQIMEQVEKDVKSFVENLNTVRAGIPNPSRIVTQTMEGIKKDIGNHLADEIEKGGWGRKMNNLLNVTNTVMQSPFWDKLKPGDNGLPIILNQGKIALGDLLDDFGIPNTLNKPDPKEELALRLQYSPEFQNFLSNYSFTGDGIDFEMNRLMAEAIYKMNGPFKEIISKYINDRDDLLVLRDALLSNRVNGAFGKYGDKAPYIDQFMKIFRRKMVELYKESKGDIKIPEEINYSKELGEPIKIYLKYNDEDKEEYYTISNDNEYKERFSRCNELLKDIK